MKVSIIIPVYNVTGYVERCLHSVMNQAYKDIECLLIDDCSTDNSMELVHRLIDEYKGPVSFSIISHVQNRGLSAARNTGIKHAVGEYIYFLDSDDVLTENAISLLATLTEKYIGVDMVQGNTLKNDKVDPVYSLKRDFPEYINDDQIIKKLFYSTSMSCIAWNKLLRKDFIIEHQLFFKEGIYHEDILWSYYIAKFMKSFAMCYDYTYVYYTNNNSITTSVADAVLQKRNKSWQIVITDIFCDMKSNDLYDKYKKYLCKCFMYYNEFLFEMKCWKQYPSFGKLVGRTFFSVRKNVNLYECLFFLNMLPPFCFFLLNEGYRWRFMNKIFKKL